MIAKRTACVALALVLLGCGTFLMAGQDSSGKRKQKQTATQSQSQSNNHASTEGEERFQQNCGRCHQSPQTLTPKSAPAVLMHMRVRANLTEEDERLILEFMNQ